MWSNDHGERFPWQVDTQDGGVRNMAPAFQAVDCFDACSNEMNSPKILVCPSDSEKTRAQVFTDGAPLANVIKFEDLNAANAHLSYFVGLTADETRPNKVLSGDRNLQGVAGGAKKTYTSENEVMGGNGPVFNGRVHQKQGNIGLSDGSVTQVATEALKRAFRGDGQDADTGNWKNIELQMPFDPPPAE
jgi:hypothetical protein